jgi:hypothetical protein
MMGMNSFAIGSASDLRMARRSEGFMRWACVRAGMAFLRGLTCPQEWYQQS